MDGIIQFIADNLNQFKYFNYDDGLPCIGLNISKKYLIEQQLINLINHWYFDDLDNFLAYTILIYPTTIQIRVTQYDSDGWIQTRFIDKVPNNWLFNYIKLAML